MPTTWYFDGSGTDTKSPIMALSGVGASDRAWEEFNKGWNTALAQLGVNVWHSTEQFRYRRTALERNVPECLLDAICKQFSQEFNTVSYAIEKAAVDALRLEHADLVPPAEAILADLCLGTLGIAQEDIGRTARLRLLFDRNEPFIRYLKRPWQAGRKELRRKKEEGWPTQIREIEPARCQDHPGVQAADLLSWVVRSGYEHRGVYDSKIVITMFTFIMAGKLRGGFLDEKTIRSLYIEKRPAPDLQHTLSFV
jgi:hypothetical protein